jgi:RNA polymerase sporulation-specific sigma factor
MIKKLKIKNEIVEYSIEQTYDKFYKYIYVLAHRYKNERNEYEDLFQVGCIGLINAYKNYDIKYNFEFITILNTYVKNEMLMVLRKNKKYVFLTENIEFIKDTLEFKNDNQINEIDKKVDLENSLKKLSKIDYLYFRYYFYENFKYREIAIMQNKSYPTVGRKIRKIVKKLNDINNSNNLKS